MNRTDGMNGVVEVSKRKNDFDVGELEDGDAGKLGEGMDSVKNWNLRLDYHYIMAFSRAQ